jgi:hypothetical protein
MSVGRRVVFRHLAHRGPSREHGNVEARPPIYRQEVVAMLFAIADLNANVERILELLEGELGGDEGLPEEDS